MGHITLGIGDIELIETDEVELDMNDVIMVEERPSRRANTGPRQVVQMPQPRRSTGRVPSFDDMPTVVRRVAGGRPTGRASAASRSGRAGRWGAF